VALQPALLHCRELDLDRLQNARVINLPTTRQH